LSSSFLLLGGGCIPSLINGHYDFERGMHNYISTARFRIARHHAVAGRARHFEYYSAPDTICINRNRATAIRTDGPMILRLSQKLSAKIRAGTLKAMPLDDNPYADWSCHLFSADRTQYIIVSSTKSLYSYVMYGKGITNDGIFIERVLNSLREFMEDDGHSFIYQRFIAPASNTVRFATALNRSVTGSMNDLIGHATGWFESGDRAPHDLCFQLNDILLSALATSTLDKYGKPNEAFKLLADIYRPTVV
jgi:hypothetical protein